MPVKYNLDADFVLGKHWVEQDLNIMYNNNISTLYL